MKVRFTKDCLIGQRTYTPGWTGEIDDGRARRAIAAGLAVLATDPIPPKPIAPAKPSAPANDPVEDLDEDLEADDQVEDPDDKPEPSPSPATTRRKAPARPRPQTSKTSKARDDK